ncbi:protein-disulfide reductase DsbD [Roseomonas sp. HF4]|uniref:protein-disulfide reductase DsbD family protein n=1 Tax=Roseomonas sp. HF4 TaxID=2562313 RepID=UPI0010C1096B|nr:protein-disulfide reductase DsbD domain-containing protein [Roseomonas sp. HF4]
MGRLLAALIALLPALGLAAESEPVRSDRAVVALMADQAAVAPGGTVMLGLRLRLAPGWHTYWKHAGDAGAAPEILPDLPAGAVAGPIAWPAPERIEYGPLVNYGYHDEVLLPFPVRLPEGLPVGGTLPVTARATWLVCAEVCIPEEGTFRIDLPVEAAPRPDPATAPLFAAAEAARPLASPWQARAGFGGGAGVLTLEGPGIGRETVRDAVFLAGAAGMIDHAAPQRLTVAPGRLDLRLVPAPGGAPTAVEGVLLLTDGGGRRLAYEVAAPVTAVVPAAMPLWQAAVFAFLGGLILNLMPCVFPVLAMKAMALARMSGEARGHVRAHALSYTAGVLLSFAALGGLMLGLRAGGAAAGWGFQFTAPGFVAAMAWLMLAVGLNLSGVFGFGGAVGAGSGVAARRGHLGSFATGGLAVLVATPCTAPFMAAALGAALAMAPAAAMAVFLALGLGLAAPYGLLAVAPGLAARMPRPGPWMERLRQGLAFPMYAAAAWLVWVLAQQAGPDAVLGVLAGGVMLGFGAWALGQAQRAGGSRIGLAAAALGLAGALALLPRIAAAPAEAAAPGPGAEAWSEARVAALRTAGRTVFVNATAAWCITCQVNERVALRGASVQAAFAAQRVAYLKADWTGGDAAIGALIRAHGRDGVPLYLVYRPGAGAPEVLPQILTEGIVLRAIGAL